MYILLCFVLHVVLMCIRQESEHKIYWTVQQYSEGWLLYPTPSAKTLKTAYHKASDNTTPQIKIKINEILFSKKLDTTCYHKPQCLAC